MKLTYFMLIGSVLAASWTGSARAQVDPEAQTRVATGIEAARDIRQNGLAVGLYQGFFSPIGVYRDGTPLDIGIFGGDAARYFYDSPEVAGHLQAFRRQKIAGVALWSAGFAALVTDLALVCAAAGNRTVLHDNEVLYWSLLGSGFATNLIGAIVMNSANHALEDAVNAHNADLLNKYLPPAERTRPVLR